jgi:hypothetical protein
VIVVDIVGSPQPDRGAEPVATQQLWPALCAILLALVVLAVAAPLLGAGFVSDDWLYLAVGRHLENPGVPFASGLLHEYFYRPATVAAWWFAERAFGLWAPGHYALSLGVHGAGAVLLGLLVRRAAPTIGRLPPLAASVLFAAMPASLGTAAWLSNRNELIAVAAGLAVLVLLAGDASRRRSAMAAALLLALALAGKETGLLFACLALLWLGWRRCRGEAITPWLWPALVLPVLILLALRSQLVEPAGVGISWQAVGDSAPGGILAWFMVLPQAFGGFQHAQLPGGWMFALAMMPVTLVPLALRQGARIGPLVVGAGLLVLLPPLLQWPVTNFVLTDPEAVRQVVNLRFFYSACAGLSVLIACALTVRGRRLRQFLVATVVLAGLLLASSSSRLVRTWAIHSAAHSDAARAIAQTVLAVGRFEPGCRIVLDRTDWPPGFVEYADVMVKSVAPRGHPALGCALFTAARAPWHAVFQRSLCGLEHWPTLPPRGQPGFELIRAYGNVCLASFHAPSSADPDLGRLRLP